MEKWRMYMEIQTMKDQGFSKRQIAEQMEIDFRTASKYLGMTGEEFNSYVAKRERKKQLASYEGVVADWLKRYPNMSGAQVLDWLKEHYQVDISKRSARRFVGWVRKKHDILKTTRKERQYQALPDPPMGQQMQIDFGTCYVIDSNTGNRRKIYCIACVLSHSRYKWGQWYATHPTTAMLVESLQECFAYMGGRAKELVFDQDSLVTVDENYGDIIYTQGFEEFIRANKIKIHLCRKSDPESKGKIEAVVKYFKGNFAKNRAFLGIDQFNESFLEWLERTGNADKHGTTKKVPAQVFEEERLYLEPIPPVKNHHTGILTRTVHKNNTIFYEGNRYSLPLGTYRSGLLVRLKIEGNTLSITDITENTLLAQHQITQDKGQLVQTRNHLRDTSETVDKIQYELALLLGGAENAATLLRQIRSLKPRYARDQFALIRQTIASHQPQAIDKALSYCLTNSLFSAVEFKHAVDYFSACQETWQQELRENPQVSILPSQIGRRPLSQYAQIAKGGD